MRHLARRVTPAIVVLTTTLIGTSAFAQPGSVQAAGSQATPLPLSGRSGQGSVVVTEAPVPAATTGVNTLNPIISDLVEFRVKTAVSDTSTVPATLSTITRYQASDATGAPVPQVFANGGGNWTINGLTYDSARLDTVSHLNTVYIWTLQNNTGQNHPFHKHLTQFQILDIAGAAPPPEQSGWKDTVLVGPGQTVRIIFKNESFPGGDVTGKYVYHCHNLEHEDHRMMLQESVVSP